MRKSAVSRRFRAQAVGFATTIATLADATTLRAGQTMGTKSKATPAQRSDSRQFPPSGAITEPVAQTPAPVFGSPTAAPTHGDIMQGAASSKHTPGPWIAVEANERSPLPAGAVVAVHRADEPYRAIGEICEMVAQGNDGKYDPEVTAANANLIAAAPELLAVCLAMHKAASILSYSSRQGQITRAVRLARAAIAKAEGRNPNA